MRPFSHIILTAILGFSNFSLAQVSQADPVKQIECNEAGNRPELEACAVAELKESDKELNATYGEFVKAMRARYSDRKSGNDRIGAIIKAQRAWIAFRDAECESDTMGSLGGTGHALELKSCLDSMTEKRTKELKEKIENIEFM